MESESLNNKIGKLLDKIKHGDNDAFYEFVDLTKNQLALSALGFLKNANDIEDAIQETYISVLTHIDSFIYDQNPMGWLYVIFKNNCLAILRNKRNDIPLDFVEDISAAFCFDDIDSLLIVKTFMETLSQKEKTIISMKLWLDMTFNDISLATNLSTAAAFRIYKRAIKKMESKLHSENCVFAPAIRFIHGGEISEGKI